MGFFFRRGNAKPRESIGDFAEKKRKEEELRRSEESHRWEEDRRILAEHEAPPAPMVPDFSLGDAYPFKNEEYITRTYLRVERETGSVVENRRVYYADAEAVGRVVDDIERLESMIDGQALSITSMPPLHTNTALIEPVINAVQLSGFMANNARMELKPFTKTGRNAIYPVSISFNAYEPQRDRYDGTLHPSENGAHGTIDYLQGGGIGKASICYWKNHVFFGVHWKTVGGSLVIGSVDYNDDPTRESVRLYTA